MNQKLKVLYLIELLMKSDETHLVTMAEILDVMKAHEIPAERKSIYDDMDALRLFGLEIVTKRGRGQAGYYLKNQEFVQKLFESGETNQEANRGTNKEETTGKISWLNGEVPVLLVGSRDEICTVQAELHLEKSFEQQEKNLREKDGKKKSKKKEETTLELNIEPNSEFFGWLTAKGTSIRLGSPSSVIREYRKYLKEIRNLYKEDGKFR